MRAVFQPACTGISAAFLARQHGSRDYISPRGFLIPGSPIACCLEPPITPALNSGTVILVADIDLDWFAFNVNSSRLVVITRSCASRRRQRQQ